MLAGDVPQQGPSEPTAGPVRRAGDPSARLQRARTGRHRRTHPDRSGRLREGGTGHHQLHGILLVHGGQDSDRPDAHQTGTGPGSAVRLRRQSDHRRRSGRRLQQSDYPTDSDRRRGKDSRHHRHHQHRRPGRKVAEGRQKWREQEQEGGGCGSGAGEEGGGREQDRVADQENTQMLL